jgi:ATP-dependent Clp protease ATP-binding subunit ClpA
MNESDLISHLLQSIELVDQAIAAVETALNSNPSPDEERALRKKLLQLQQERAALQAELDAVLDGDTQVNAPTKAQMVQVEALLTEVERARNQALSAATGIRLASRVLGLLVDVAA